MGNQQPQRAAPGAANQPEGNAAGRAGGGQVNDLEQNAGGARGGARDGAAGGQQVAPSTSAKNKKKVHTIKNQSNIKKETIKLVQLPNEPNKYSLEMKFDANYECVITVYLCSMECRNAGNIPLYFYCDPQMPAPCAFRFSSGLNQKFPSKVFIIDVNKLKPQLISPDFDLFTPKGDFCPIVIQIETVYPQNYRGRGKKNCQFTYGYFEKDATAQSKAMVDKSENPTDAGAQNYTLRFKYQKQKLLYNNQIMDLNDIYGIDNSAANLADESQKECVVCYTATKDTVVLPCRHMCLCIDCSQIVRMQTNKCPICRTQVSSFLHVKYEVNLPKSRLNNDAATRGAQQSSLANQPSIGAGIGHDNRPVNAQAPGANDAF